MRRSKADTQKTREQIVAAAADELRDKGIAGANLTDVMAAVGLTHGGFYRHFENRDQLLAEGLKRAIDVSQNLLTERLAVGGVNQAVTQYLTADHRDAKIPRCPYAGLGSELKRDPGLKAEASRGLMSQIDAIHSELGDSADAQDRAALILTTMVGALVVSRLVEDRELSDRILDLASKQSLALASGGSRTGGAL
ncbi:TetR family transcriptional regulator [Gluconacetobacter sacchari DSM 12717]|uniref:TetR family transcriptional regulator n=2 Tax=Gluconacetobacter sacchari TaxID=92759 RepID=A0A7W4NRP4_9PROT|nr:TetR family transcriptional regulator [Gluconacetobacter sacchari]MBB2161188.1 TetR family transcriptional regulator [Gluconacetobacter sacchari]GBQ20834.1 TetR family transcriptional regulator [Gluconacetobacter sacchari DSM 12717]